MTRDDNKPLVFIVDDVPNNIQIITNILSAENFNVSFSLGGDEIISKVLKIKPDLILLDIMMPNTDGYEICRSLKITPEIKDIPVIFVTGKSAFTSVNNAFECGAVDYIIKPFNSKELLNRVKTHINLKRMNDRLIRQNIELAEAKKKLQEQIDLKAKFFSVIAHDLRSPFSGFIGLTDLLKNDIDSFDRKDLADLAITLSDSARKFYNLLENLLTWASTQTGSFKFADEVINIKTKFDRIIEIYKASAEAKNINILNNLKNECFAYCDSQALDTVLRNLIGNAVKYSFIGGNIVLDAEESDDNMIMVSISDSGVGMQDSQIKQLFSFEHKISTPGTANEHGSGLGLQICKELVEAQGGKISVESVPDKGTTFKFTIQKSINRLIPA